MPVIQSSILILSMLGSMHGQQPATKPQRHTTILGKVVAAETQEALRHVEVRLSGGTLKTPRLAKTNSKGEYLFEGVQEGRYTLSAWKLGYVRSGFGVRGEGIDERPLTVDTMDVARCDFTLMAAGVIVAAISDEFGEPIAGAWVTVLRAVADGPNRKFVDASGNGFIATTDDRGQVRLFNLAPGVYYVAARITSLSRINARGVTTPQTFYPGTQTAAEAYPIRVEAGKEVTVAFPVAAAPLVRIRGIIIASSGQPDSVSSVQLLALHAGGVSSYPVARFGDGQFVANVVPGSYLFQVRPSSGNQRPEYANKEINVSNEDLDDLVISTAPAAYVSGRITLEDAEAGVRIKAESIKVVPKFIGNTVAPGRASIRIDGRFDIREILGFGFLRAEDQTGEWGLEGVYRDGREITDEPVDFAGLEGKDIEIRMTRRMAALSGVVGNSRNEPLSNYTVVLFPQDPQLWRQDSRFIRTGRPDQFGRFALEHLPAGEYFVAAVAVLQRGAEYSADFLQELRLTSERVTLSKGEARQLALRVKEPNR